MNLKKQNLMAGLFVLAGIALLLAMLFFLGLSNLFVHKVMVRTTFSESVQGLSRGSAVKYRGVQIGTVDRICILVSDQKIQVDMEIEPEHFFVADRNLGSDTRAFASFWEKEVREKGLCARMEMLGITGMKYVDFDYFSKRRINEPTPRFIGSQNALFIPSVTSQMKDLSTTLTLAVDRLSKIRYEQIAENIDKVLLQVYAFLNAPELKSAMVRINETADNFEQMSAAVASNLTEARIKQITTLFQNNLEQLKKLQQEISSMTTRSDIPGSAASFRRAADSLSEGRMELANTLLKMNQTLEAIRAAADYLGTDPSSVLRGKQKPVQRDVR